jgi:hypothetical protein
MKLSSPRLSVALLVCLMAIVGCNRSNDAAVTQAKAEAEAAKAEAQAAKAELVTAQARAADAEGELAKLKSVQVQPKPTDTDRKAAEWVLRIGGTVRVFADGVLNEYPKDGKLPDGSLQLVYVDLNQPAGGGRLTNEGMKLLEGLKHVKQLHMNWTNAVSDFQFLNSMAELEVFAGTINDDDLSHFQRPNQIRELILSSHLGNQKFTDAGLSRLKVFKNLERLELVGSKISDKGLSGLAELRNLRYLGLGHTDISGTGLAHLKDMTKLETLVLEASRITDTSLAHLKVLPGLDTIRLNHNSGITDSGLIHLKGITKLKLLTLNETKVSETGIADLKKSLPNCQIVTK